MGMRQFTRLTNGFSKKMKNFGQAVAHYYFHYNFFRKHMTSGSTPAVTAGLTPEPAKPSDLVDMLN